VVVVVTVTGRREVNLTKRAFLNEEVVSMARVIDTDGRACRYC